jgi:hypothetical protein
MCRAKVISVTESLPAKIGGSRPTGLGVVVVSAVTVQLNEKRVAVVLTTTSPKPVGLDAQFFAGRLPVTCIRPRP